MAKNNREKELKILIQQDYKSLEKLLSKFYATNNKTVGSSKDIYWKNNRNTEADFFRLRFLSNLTGQVTVKHEDKLGSFDRVEIDLEVKDPKQAKLLFTRLLGNPIGSIEKKYIVYWMDLNTNVSLYEVKHSKEVFLEIEGLSKKTIDKIYKTLNPILGKHKVLNKSLFARYFK